MQHMIQWLGFAAWILASLLRLTHTRFSPVRFAVFVPWTFVALGAGFLLSVSGSSMLHFAFTLAGLYRLYRVRAYLTSSRATRL